MIFSLCLLCVCVFVVVSVYTIFSASSRSPRVYLFCNSTHAIHIAACTHTNRVYAVQNQPSFCDRITDAAMNTIKYIT